MAKDT